MPRIGRQSEKRRVAHTWQDDRQGRGNVGMQRSFSVLSQEGPGLLRTSGGHV